jgi:predicted HicB family RNase H-like nuclease
MAFISCTQVSKAIVDRGKSLNQWIAEKLEKAS